MEGEGLKLIGFMQGMLFEGSGRGSVSLPAMRFASRAPTRGLTHRSLLTNPSGGGAEGLSRGLEGVKQGPVRG